MMTVSMDRSASRTLAVSRRYSDSGVVIRMSDGSRWNRARSADGVSPVRTDTVGIRNASPRLAARFAMPASGVRRLRSISTASAFSGDTYSTRQRGSAGGGSNISRLMHHKNAVSVFPLPVGARISVESPLAIAGHPCSCGGVGASNEARNQSATAG